jgi:methylthioribulose-1-phosphate dehydratase
VISVFVSLKSTLKGMRVTGMAKAMSYLDTLEIPIIKNTPDEEDLRETMEQALIDFPNA